MLLKLILIQQFSKIVVYMNWILTDAVFEFESDCQSVVDVLHSRFKGASEFYMGLDQSQAKQLGDTPIMTLILDHLIG